MLSPTAGTAAREALEAAATVEGPRYRQAFEAGDPKHTAVWFGDAAGVIHSIR